MTEHSWTRIHDWADVCSVCGTIRMVCKDESLVVVRSNGGFIIGNAHEDCDTIIVESILDS